MCNIEEVTISESDKVELDHQQITTHLMDSPTANPDSAPSSNDETTRVKFLCSFSGSILPRPQDGKLRYVGGETRIVSVPRDITYEELMSKMRELFEGANVLKYQQPDEDLDALVSVVNDDDVTNMMEEYDKLGSGDGFTRLRIFLFVHPDQDSSLHFVNGDERDNERRYVDALNSLNESPNFRKQQSESLGGSFEDVHGAEQYFSPMSLEGSIHGQRNMELPMAQMNLRQLTIPRLGSGQLQQPVAQRYNDMEAPWSPAYYSPRQPSSVEPRPVPEFPISPSSSRYRLAYGDFSDRVPEDYNRTPINIHPIHEQHLQYQDNVVVVSPSPAVNEKAGFPGNILQGSNVYEGNSICEYCRMAYHRNQVYPEHQHVDPPSMGSAGYIPGSNSCVESPANREIYVMNRDANLHPPFHCRDHYHDTHSHERGWVSPHQSSPWAEELRPPVSAGYIVENGVGIPVTHGNAGGDSHHLQPHYVHHEDHHYVRPGVDYGAQMMHDQAIVGGSQIHLPAMDERVVRYLNPPYVYGNDSVCQVPHVHMPSHTLWRNVHNPVPVVPSYEASTSSQVANGSTPKGFIRESSPRLKTGLDYQNPWIDQSQRVVGLDGSHVPDYSHNQVLKLAPNTYMMENQQPSAVELPNIPLVVSHNLRNYNDPCPDSEFVPLVGNALGANISASVANIQGDTGVAKSATMNENNVFDEMKETNIEEAKDSTICGAIDQKSDTFAPSGSISLGVRQPKLDVSGLNVEVTSACAPKEAPDDQLDFLPELIESVKEAALQSLKEVKAKVQVETDLNCDNDAGMKEDAQNHKDGVEGNVDVVDPEHDNDNANHPEIELTKAEAEAIDRGLQTIKYEDLEEIRELGSGTYGSVYHGKWKGSDVAIKKIKASCFAARPSERERLIADFWKEALLLSSLHHPNVVSFYGVVRDGPDGSLATVTEYMVNGSLKQYLQKKNSTIDRRKRIIIAMDVAIGMEYLHEKKIVHFDLKCENLLVNMRDPHRPVCKIADMGLSKVRHKTLVSGGVRGTLPWMAPELLNGKCNMVSEKIDVYSFAIVMWELLTGDEPYANMHGASIIGGIVNNTLRPQTPERCDPEWKSLMESCWAADPTQRPSFSEISQKLRNMAAPMNPK